MIVKSFTFNDFEEHCYVLSNNNEAIVIDPGCCYESERIDFCKYIKENKLTIKHVLNTHLHVDHILGNRFIQDTYGVGAEAAEEDEILLENMYTQASMFGLVGRSFSESDFFSKLEAYPLSNTIKDGDTISISDIELKVLSVPGHTLGHLAFYCPSECCIFVGDILFRGGIGRTDLTGKDPREMQNLLVKGIREKLFYLPNDTVVFPGHGQTTSISQEKEYNPYL